MTVGARAMHLRSLGVCSSIAPSCKKLEPLMFMPKAALKLCFLLSLLVFEAELRMDGDWDSDSTADGEAEKRSGLCVVEDTFERFCAMSAVPLFNGLMGSFLAPRFFFYTGAVLAYSKRSSRTAAW